MRSTSKNGPVDPVATREIDGVVKSAKRVLELFELFAQYRRPLAVNDLVRALDYPQSSASALLKSLVRLGYLDYNRFDRLYVPTLRVALIGGWVQDQLLRESSLSHLIDELHRRSGGKAVILGRQNDIYVQYIHVVQAPTEEIPWYIKPGSLRPLGRTAIGRILLARKSDAEVKQTVWRINAEEAEPELRLNANELLKELNQIREQGFAHTEGLVNPLTGVIAIEMPTMESQSPMALGIGGTVEMVRANQTEILELLKEAVRPYRTILPVHEWSREVSAEQE